MDIRTVLNFWFGQTEQRRREWFIKDTDFDQLVEATLGELYPLARDGQLTDWQTTAQGCLALVILLDQYPRNVFRDQPAAFATDALALAIAQAAITQNFDQQLTPWQRLFLYLPFEHSEELAMQEQCLRLFASFPEIPDKAELVDYAQRHHRIIQRFGRFPHRNPILGRPSTPAETEFIQQPSSSF